MKARQLIEEADLGPDTIVALTRAFEDAWEDVASNFSNPAAIDSARHKMAHAILAAANGSDRDVEALKRAGLSAMTQHYDF